MKTAMVNRMGAAPAAHGAGLQILRMLVLCAGILAIVPALGQTLPEYAMKGAERARDLDLPAQPSPIDDVVSPQMALYKPEGAGPFPALVLLHQCGGLRNNLSMLDWARQAVAHGYVVMQLDSFTQRGVDKVCQGPKNDVFFSRGLRDAVQAAALLRKLPYVDPRRVAFAGYSWGAATGLQAASKRSAAALGLADRFDALVAFYPPCNAYPKNGTPPYTLVLAEIDRPLLVLLGGRDNETPPEECVAGLAPQKAAAAPVDWHLYPAATHCWDCRHLHGLRKTDIRGSTVEYLYDADITRESAERMFGFIDKAFGRRP